MKNKIRLTKSQKKKLKRIIISLVLFIIAFIVDKIFDLNTFISGKFSWLLPFGIFLAIYVIIGYDVVLKAIRNIGNGQFLDENFLMCIATWGAFALAIYRGINGLEVEGFDEACAVLIFYQVGEFFQDYATKKSRKSISELMDIRPDVANVIRDGIVYTVHPSEVNVEEIILINPGEKIPLDGIVVKGESTLDTKALTGESLPREVLVDDEVVSGCVNISSQIEIKVVKAFYDSTVNKILELVENASNQKSKAENFITKFARYYTPIVVFSAIFVALIPSIITGQWSIWVYRALNFLVVSCPCALVISIPLSFFAGIGVASRNGILIKGSNYIEKINKSNIFVFDKTGTLTKGTFNVTDVIPNENRDSILELASIAEQNSSHPIARSILSSYGRKIELTDYVLTNVAGEGIIAKNSDNTILCGNEKLMINNNIDYEKTDKVGTIVYVALNGEYKGCIIISDEIKEETKDVISSLNGLGYKTIMLTGDNESVASSVANQCGVSEFKSSLLPQGKVECIEKLMQSKNENDILCFIGDGINDSPSLMRSDIGIAMGGVGSDAAIEASDVVFMEDNLNSIIIAKKIAKKIIGIVNQNIYFSIIVKIAILILSIIGITNMWVAIFGDVGVAVLAILNAMRINSKKLVGKK